MLLYPIAANSKPRSSRSRKVRESLDAVDDLIGLAVAFPTAPSETDPSSTIAVDLSRVPVAAADEDTGDGDYTDVEGERNDVDLGDG